MGRRKDTAKRRAIASYSKTFAELNGRKPTITEAAEHFECSYMALYQLTEGHHIQLFSSGGPRVKLTPSFLRTAEMAQQLVRATYPERTRR